MEVLNLSALVAASNPAAAQTVPMAPVLLLALCAIAGIGTVLLLPSRREGATRKIGGAILLSAGVIFALVIVRWAAGQRMGAYFWIFSFLALLGSVRVITHPKPVYSALYFVLTVFASAGLFLLLWAEFVAVALVIIYAGAILVTYVFVIMLAAEAGPRTTADASGHSNYAGLADHDLRSREPLMASVVGFALMGLLLFVIFDRYTAIPRLAAGIGEVEGVAAADDPTRALGAYLFTNQLISVQLAGLLLTVAMIGAIVIARKRVIVPQSQALGQTLSAPELVLGPSTPVDDNPHSIPVVGTRNPAQKAFPEN